LFDVVDDESRLGPSLLLQLDAELLLYRVEEREAAVRLGDVR
jgi:hypothetical protein